MALPPPGEGEQRQGGRRNEPENPNDLWDDPLAAENAAADFSAFGMIPDDPKDTTQGEPLEAFNFDDMAAASNRFDKILRGGSDATGDAPSDSADGALEPDMVSEPDVSSLPAQDRPAEQPGNQSPSSRLMQMIGVGQLDAAGQEAPPADDHVAPQNHTEPASNPWAIGNGGSELENHIRNDQGGATQPDLAFNPWSKDPEPVSNSVQKHEVGFDLAARAGVVASTGISGNGESLLKRRQEQEAQQSRDGRLQGIGMVQEQDDSLHARKLAQEQQLRQQQQMQQQQQSGYSQVELILMERISLILEKSWGRADLVTLLTTLHAEDSRVVPLLGTTDALRALLARHPARVAIRPDHGFGIDMAILLLTQTQFQNEPGQKDTPAAEPAQKETFVQSTPNVPPPAPPAPPPIVDGAPWYYSDPQKNIQVCLSFQRLPKDHLSRLSLFVLFILNILVAPRLTSFRVCLYTFLCVFVCFLGDTCP